MKYDYVCSYEVDVAKAENFKYIVIIEGDLDINNAIFLKSKRDLDLYLAENKEFGLRAVEGVFAVELD
jgi:hypothetical protein